MTTAQEYNRPIIDRMIAVLALNGYDDKESQASQLVKNCGIAPRTAQRWVNGVSGMVRNNHLEGFMRNHKVDPNWLLTGDGVNPENVEIGQAIWFESLVDVINHVGREHYQARMELTKRYQDGELTKRQLRAKIEKLLKGSLKESQQ